MGSHIIFHIKGFWSDKVWYVWDSGLVSHCMELLSKVTGSLI